MIKKIRKERRFVPFVPLKLGRCCLRFLSSFSLFLLPISFHLNFEALVPRVAYWPSMVVCHYVKTGLAQVVCAVKAWQMLFTIPFFLLSFPLTNFLSFKF